MIVFGGERSLFCLSLGIACGIVGFSCAPQMPKDELKYMADILNRLADTLTEHRSRNCSRLNEHLSVLHGDVDNSLRNLWIYHRFIVQRSLMVKSFHVIDSNKDGQISRDEFKQYMETESGYYFFNLIASRLKVRVSTAEEVIDGIFENYDSDQNSMISTNEFIDLMMRHVHF